MPPGRDACMVFEVLDPTRESSPPLGKLAPRPMSLRGTRVGFISNGKEDTKGYFAHLDRMLREEFGVAHVVSRVKSNYSAPADAHNIGEIANWDAIVTGIGD